MVAPKTLVSIGFDSEFDSLPSRRPPATQPVTLSLKSTSPRTVPKVSRSFE